VADAPTLRHDNMVAGLVIKSQFLGPSVYDAYGYTVGQDVQLPHLLLTCMKDAVNHRHKAWRPRAAHHLRTLPLYRIAQRRHASPTCIGTNALWQVGECNTPLHTSSKVPVDTQENI
jgi:hypothetical protein